MNIQEIKQIKIEEFLHSIGYTPDTQQGINLWYKSPLREETEASFKVNTERNLWYDFATGKGGNIIALAAELYRTDDIPYLLCRIEEQASHCRPVFFSFGRQSSSLPSFQKMEVKPLQSPALLDYLRERKINIAVAKATCKEIHFENNGKRYFAIGFQNVSRGYEVRNRYFKGCIAPKDITHLRFKNRHNGTCFVFEGFMDYLSFLTIRLEKCPNLPNLDLQDYIILNFTAKVSEAIDRLADYERIHCFLDNDRAGLDAYMKISREYTYKVRDASQTYAGFKDLNEYLCRTQEPSSDKTHQKPERNPTESDNRQKQEEKEQVQALCLPRKKSRRL